MARRILTAALLVTLVTSMTPAAADDDVFVDDDASVHEADIDAIAGAGITRGCNPPANDRFCPDRPVTRAEMATFLVRALAHQGGDIPTDTLDAFGDDDTSVHESAIDALAAMRITRGCRPGEANGSTRPVTTPDGPSPGSQLVDVRVGSTAGIDRLVLEFDGRVPGYDVRYVDLPVIADPSGEPVALEGDRAIGIRLAYTSAADLEGDVTYDGPRRFTPRFDRMVEVVQTGDFERVVNWAIGVDASPGFTVTVLDDPDRIVIDLGPGSSSGSTAAFCPDDPMTREQMAAFLVRAFRYPETDPLADWFADDNGSQFEAEIEALAAAGITLGCNPPHNDRFCPGDPVTRGQMASFLVRALDL